jgi:hypothetical protein
MCKACGSDKNKLTLLTSYVTSYSAPSGSNGSVSSTVSWCPVCGSARIHCQANNKEEVVWFLPDSSSDFPATVRDEDKVRREFLKIKEKCK